MNNRSAHLLGKEQVRIEDRKIELADDQVLVRSMLAGVCDADLRIYKGLSWPDDLPSFEWLGHEGGGEVVEVGRKVREYKPGDKVMLFGPDNSWANYFTAPVRNLHPVPEGMDMEVACLGEPTAVGMFGVFHSGVEIGDDVVVAGLNFQGMIAVQGLKRKGAGRVIAVDYSRKHLDLARKLGADVVIDSTKTDARQEILELTKGAGADVTFLSCGYWNPRAEEYFMLCVDTVKDEGIFLSLPDLMGTLTVNLHRLHHHGIDVRFPALMHHGPAFRERWVPRVLRPVAQGLIDIKSLITARYPLEQADAAMKSFAEDLDHIKIVLETQAS